MYVYFLLAKFEEIPTRIAIKQKMLDEPADLLQPQETNPKAQIILPDLYNSTKALKGTKTKNVTFNWSNMTEEEYNNNTWDYYYRSFDPQLNFSSSNYSRVKLLKGDESPYIPKAPIIAKVFHLATPRLDVFFQKVDNRVTDSTEYVYVSIYNLM